MQGIPTGYLVHTTSTQPCLERFGIHIIQNMFNYEKKQMFSASLQQPVWDNETEGLGSEEFMLQYTMVSGISPRAEPKTELGESGIIRVESLSTWAPC